MSSKNLAEKISFRKFKIHFMRYFKIFYGHYEEISWKSKRCLVTFKMFERFLLKDIFCECLISIKRIAVI